MIYDVVIAGAGVIGCMLARELTKYKVSVCMLEKENDVAMGASKANSGIIHGGFDPLPGTLKAKLNVDGVKMLYETARELNVPYENNGSLVVALGKNEESIIDELFQRGIENGVEGMEVISGDEARNLEKNLSKDITKALLVKNAGIICPYVLTIAAAGNAIDNGALLLRNFEIISVIKNEYFEVCSKNGQKITGRFFVNCAGVFADKIASMLNDSFYNLIPRAGQYMLLDKEEGKTVSHTVFQVPTEKGKGVLVTPTVDGNLLLGPTAESVDNPENTETTNKGLNEVVMLARKSISAINTKAVITSFCGVRASEKNGDFIICASKKVNGFIHVAAIDSPGLSSCVAIAKYVVNILNTNGLDTVKNQHFNGIREDSKKFQKMNDEEKNVYIKSHPLYGKIVCRCENISEGEIRDAIEKNPQAYDVDGVKRRTRSGMGRCQGGFCLPYVIKILSEENNDCIETITKKGIGSNIVVGNI